jgi:hypothetical protein
MTAIDTSPPPATTRRRATDITLWVVQVLLAAFFLVAAAGPKLAGQQYAVEMFTQIGAGQWFRYLVGSSPRCSFSAPSSWRSPQPSWSWCSA